MRHPLFLWTYFLSVGQEEMGRQSLYLYFVVLPSTGHLAKGWDKGGVVLMGPPWLEGPSTPTHRLLVHLSAAQLKPHQDERRRGHFSLSLM